MSNTDKTVEWNNLPWREIEKVIFKLQKRIYQASKDGDIKAVRKLQKTLINSWYAKLIAVRKVTQDNTGKNTAGIDGVKSLTPKQRLQLAKDLKMNGKSKPTRRVWIPKPGKVEKRPLGIPVMEERAKQALVKSALEPEWEAKFEPNSFGFRPGRSCHDAIGQVYMSIKQKAKYALDADIAGCFDNIDHNALLKKVKKHFQTLSDIIKNSKAKNQAKLIERLNPIIKGWSNYYSKVVSKAIYNKLDALVYWQLVRWGLKRHPSKSKAWVSNRYWHSIDGWKRTFATRESEGSLKLIRHIEKPIKRHIQIQRNKSPYDGDWVYWSKRRGNYPGKPSTVAHLLKEQRGKCPHCNLNFFSDDLLEVHHKDKNRKNNRRTNLEVLHKHCHQNIHKQRYA